MGSPLSAVKKTFLGAKPRTTALRALALSFAIACAGTLALTPVKLESGSYGLIYRLAYRNQEPERGDLVAVGLEAGESAVFVKRVVALSKESIEIRDGTTRINGTPLAEPYAVGAKDWNLPPRLVPAGHVYVIGDDRSQSIQAHRMGHVDRRRILGRVLWIPAQRSPR